MQRYKGNNSNSKKYTGAKRDLNTPVGQGLANFTQKRTIFLGTLPGLHKLSRKCPGDHVHQHVESSMNVRGVSVKRSVIAGRYAVDMCEELAKVVSVAMAQASSARAKRVS